MGYSIGIRPRSQKLRDHMLAFMDREYRSWPKLQGRPHGDFYASGPTGTPGYDHRVKWPLGIDYGPCSDWEREYAYTIVRFMALKVGTNRTSFSNGLKRKKPTPFMVYDGYETWPLLVGTTAQNARLPEKLQWCAVDNLGIPNGPNAQLDLVPFSMLAVPPKKLVALLEASKATQNATERLRSIHKKLLTSPELAKDLKDKSTLIREELARLDALWNVP